MHPFLPIPGACADSRRVAGSVPLAEQAPTLTARSGEGAVDAGGNAAVAWLVLRGRVEVRAREGHFTLGPRDWIALDADSMPRAVLARDAWLLGIGLGMASHAGIAAPARTTLLPGRGRMAPGVRRQALRLWRANGAFPGAVPMPARVAALAGFVSTLQAELIAGIGRCPGHTERRKRQVLQRMQRARLYLEGQAGAGLRIADLARRINFSPWYFSKVFHAVYGIGPMQFGARMRLEHASRLLATTRLPVTEVSAACGFDNPCSFARAFRAQFGMTASEHRLRSAPDAAPHRACLPEASLRLARCVR